MGECYAEMEQLDAADRLLGEALEVFEAQPALHPSFMSVFQARFKVLLARQEFDEAKQLLDYAKHLLERDSSPQRQLNLVQIQALERILGVMGRARADIDRERAAAARDLASRQRERD